MPGEQTRMEKKKPKEKRERKQTKEIIQICQTHEHQAAF